MTHRYGRAGTLVVSLDFELHWGVRDVRRVADYRENLLGVRDAVPALLATFREFGIHATWATVGLLFFETKREMMAALPAVRPAYRRAELSPYGSLADVGDDERHDPFHFAPSLVRRIAATADQEIGTHTFSHYYCLEAGQTPVDFREDLEAAIAVARAKLGLQPRSIVFPRNQVDPRYVDVCRSLGFTAYRGNPPSWAYRARPQRAESLVRRAVRLADAYVPVSGSGARPVDVREGLLPLDVPASRYLRPHAPRLRALDALRLRRITTDLRRAATRGDVYHLWWHPHDFGVHLRENLAFLRRVLACFATLRETHGMRSLTMGEVAEEAVSVEPGWRTGT